MATRTAVNRVIVCASELSLSIHARVSSSDYELHRYWRLGKACRDMGVVRLAMCTIYPFQVTISSHPLWSDIAMLLDHRW